MARHRELCALDGENPRSGLPTTTPCISVRSCAIANKARPNALLGRAVPHAAKSNNGELDINDVLSQMPFGDKDILKSRFWLGGAARYIAPPTRPARSPRGAGAVLSGERGSTWLTSTGKNTTGSDSWRLRLPRGERSRRAHTSNAIRGCSWEEGVADFGDEDRELRAMRNAGLDLDAPHGVGKEGAQAPKGAPEKATWVARRAGAAAAQVNLPNSARPVMIRGKAEVEAGSYRARVARQAASRGRAMAKTSPPPLVLRKERKAAARISPSRPGTTRSRRRLRKAA